MSESAGTGSPIFFFCTRARKQRTYRDGRLSPIDREEHLVKLTGRERPYRAQRHHAFGVRSSHVSREYICACGHRGWSNHKDLERLAEREREKAGDEEE